MSGLDRLADLVVAFDPCSPAARERFPSFISSAGNVLRVLSGTLTQARPPEADPKPAPITQDRLPEAILDMLQKVETELVEAYRRSLSTSTDEGMTEDKPSERSLLVSQLRSLMVLMLRSLHVVLGFSRIGIIGPWTSRSKASIGSYLQVQMSLLSMYAGTHAVEEGLFALLIDTLWYYIDGQPSPT